MIPQGTTILNTEIFTNLTAAAQAAPTCAALQSVTDSAFASLNALDGAMSEEYAALEPILALLTAPAANPSAIVTWITNFISAFLTPIAKPAINYPTQVTEFLSQKAALEAAIEAAAAALPSCTITIPDA